MVRLTKKRFLYVTVALAGVIGSALTIALLLNISERKTEARHAYFNVITITDDTQDPSLWGKNFPLQYDDYKKTVDMERTRFGGSEALPRAPTQADPRSKVAQSRLQADPRLVTLWLGYAFSKDFREDRGHAYMLEDQIFTGRQKAAPQPGTCLHCHASVYTTYKKLGNGDLIKGFEKLNPMPYAEAKKYVSHPVSCIDCHSPDTMELRVTRPGFIEGIAALKASQGIKNYNVNTMATRQEMRTFACAQCHVEYYFKGKEKRLVYPWAKGIKVEEILSYYDKTLHKDWIHAQSGAEVLKAQHPEFELWSQGIHAKSGVSCADCHMPYKRVGAMKISDHHVRSPMLNISRACQTCHRFSESELKDRVEKIQETTFKLRNQAMDAVIDLIHDIKKAKDLDKSDSQLALARQFQRRAQFYLDFIEAENSSGFHAPQEAARILAESINYARQGQLSLRNLDK